LKRGTIRISDELDLHDFSVTRRLPGSGTSSKAHLSGSGSGAGDHRKRVNSPEGPVLQGAVAAWLRERGKGMVAEFSSAPRDKGGTGAFVVFLKKK
jgi:DNA-nicking Smr family endonuclease